MVKLCLRTLRLFALVVSLAATARSAEVLFNGSFEDPDLSGSGGFQEIFAPDSSSLPGWTVSMGSIDQYNDTIQPLGTAFDGHQFIDLDGGSAGQVFQTFTTNPGTEYQFSFAYADNYEVGTPPKSAQVRIFDSNGDLFNMVILHGTSTALDLDWFTLPGAFIATDTTATIEFTSLDAPNSVSGILVDAVSVEAIPETSTVVSATLMCAALVAYALRRAKKAEVRK